MCDERIVLEVIVTQQLLEYLLREHLQLEDLGLLEVRKQEKECFLHVARYFHKVNYPRYLMKVAVEHLTLGVNSVERTVGDLHWLWTPLARDLGKDLAA